jgi:glycosyltransferase involved in cell wall biosynthesis
MRILIATDAWEPQVNGVVRSLQQTAKALGTLGCETTFLTPVGFRTLPLPSYPEIRLALARPSRVEQIIDEGAFDAIHVATEGPIGIVTRRICRRQGRVFTTSYHTRYPEYLRARAPVPESWSYAWLRRFHNGGAATLVVSETLRRELAERGFERLSIWSRGVDTALFRPRETSVLSVPRPVFLYVGRLAVEKNVEAFLDLDLPGTKVVVGDGPLGAKLREQHPRVVFLGTKAGEALAEIYAAADVFVFPSRTDTYGIVLLEALASGLPIAAFPVPGPADVVDGQAVGVLDRDLRAAALAALSIPKSRCRDFAHGRSWDRSAREFLDNIVGVTDSRPLC